VTAPFNYTKVAYQVELADPRVCRGELPRYRGLVDCALQRYRSDGLLGFYRGHVFNCLRYFPTQAFNLCMKDTFKRLFPKYNAKTEFLKFVAANTASGTLAAAASLAWIYPFDRAREAAIVDAMRGRKPEGLLDYIKKIVRKGGLQSLWTGLGVSLVGIIVYRAFQLFFFDKVMKSNPFRTDKGPLGEVTRFAAGQAAITFGAAATYPLDTLRRRLGWQGFYDENVEYTGVLDCANKIYAEEGLTGFYRGFGASVSVSVLNALLMIGYGKARRLLL
jgi:solute carrier family 25 (adenine nucleotide translocator) protein 4/5/6/31